MASEGATDSLAGQFLTSDTVASLPSASARGDTKRDSPNGFPMISWNALAARHKALSTA